MFKDLTNSFPLGRGVSVLASHPCGLFALAKPPVIRSHPNDDRPDSQALLTCPFVHRQEAYQWTQKNGTTQPVFLLNRLDAPTSGIVLLCLNTAVAQAVRRCFAFHTVEKQYYAWVKGHLPETKMIWRDCLRTERRRGSLRTRRTYRPGKSAITEVRVQQRLAGACAATLLSLCPRTGRTHQLRVQCAARGYPILGDKTYGDFDLNRTLGRLGAGRRLLLHNNAIALRFEYRGGYESFQADSPLPSIFAKLPELNKRARSPTPGA